MWQRATRPARTDPVRRRAAGRPASLLLRATARDQVSIKSPRAGPAVRRRAWSGCPSQAAQGPGGVGAAPPAADRQRAGERSARGGVLQYTHLPRRGVPEIPSEAWRGPRVCEAAKVSQADLALPPARRVTLGKSLLSLGLVLPICTTKALQADVHELDPRRCLRSWASSSGGASVSISGP